MKTNNYNNLGILLVLFFVALFFFKASVDMFDFEGESSGPHVYPPVTANLK